MRSFFSVLATLLILSVTRSLIPGRHVLLRQSAYNTDLFLAMASFAFCNMAILRLDASAIVGSKLGRLSLGNGRKFFCFPEKNMFRYDVSFA